MSRIAFKMKLFKGKEDEYKKRHDVIWPELQLLLKEKKIHDYSIFLDEETNILFAVMNVEDDLKLAELSFHPVMKRWWAHMSDIMETNADQSPVSINLKEVFFLP